MDLLPRPGQSNLRAPTTPFDLILRSFTSWAFDNPDLSFCICCDLGLNWLWRRSGNRSRFGLMLFDVTQAVRIGVRALIGGGIRCDFSFSGRSMRWLR
ncbi:hypothetical protein RchiOBHm_Chr4g0412241 [Rosa chinensis]|uniref:Uncharacterized protein n=1 Tax=Rosa chinensis TaxID=74649 RepID=A0A2P6QVV0_ROSCH|nr:hypothetical protein RchiOBHm_Chr4g0412241 [Rosa chinensis]